MNSTVTPAALSIAIALYAGKEQQATIHGREIHSALTELRRLRSEIALRDRALQWCLKNGASRCEDGEIIDNGSCYGGTDSVLEAPADIAAIISGKADSEVER